MTYRKKQELMYLGRQLVQPILFAAIGVTMVCNPDSVSRLVGSLLGWIIVAAGVAMAAFAWKNAGQRLLPVVGSVACLNIGIRLLRRPLTAVQSMGRIAGVLLLIKGIQELRDPYRMHAKAFAWGQIAAGAALTFLPMAASRLALTACGAFILVIGIVMAVSRLSGRKRLNYPDRPDIIDAE